MKSAQKPWLYFSDSVDPALKNKVLGIAAQNCDRFESATLGFENTESDFRSKIKFVAWQDEENHSWTVDKITSHETATGSIPAPKETVMRGACFFDALYYTAYFEKTEKDMGAQVMAMPEKAPHFRVAGETAGQPFDAQNMPHPAVKGNILTNGSFDAHAYEVAARTETLKPAVLTPQHKAHNPMLKERFMAALPQASNENKATSALVVPEKDVLAQIEAKENELANLHKALEGGEAFLNLLKEEKKLADEDINAGTMVLGSIIIICLTALSFGIAAVIIAAVIGNEYHKENKALNSARRATKALPEGPVKSLMEEFNKNARFTMYAERAARQVQNCADKNKPVKARRKSFKNIEKAAKELDLAPAEVQKLKADFLQQVYKPGDFYDLLKKQWEESEIQPEIKKTIKALERGMTP